MQVKRDMRIKYIINIKFNVKLNIMKKSIIKTLVIISSLMALQACNQKNTSPDKENSVEVKKELVHADYQCPMDCEQGKIYHEPGKCPVCGMDLIKVEHRHEHPSHTNDSIGHEDKHEHTEGDGHKH